MPPKSHTTSDINIIQKFSGSEPPAPMSMQFNRLSVETQQSEVKQLLSSIVSRKKKNLVVIKPVMSPHLFWRKAVLNLDGLWRPMQNGDPLPIKCSGITWKLQSQPTPPTSGRPYNFFACLKPSFIFVIFLFLFLFTDSQNTIRELVNTTVADDFKKKKCSQTPLQIPQTIHKTLYKIVDKYKWTESIYINIHRFLQQAIPQPLTFSVIFTLLRRKTSTDHDLRAQIHRSPRISRIQIYLETSCRKVCVNDQQLHVKCVVWDVIVTLIGQAKVMFWGPPHTHTPRRWCFWCGWFVSLL